MKVRPEICFNVVVFELIVKFFHFELVTKYHCINFLDVDELNSSYCYEFGRKMIHGQMHAKKLWYSTEGTINLSIVPPYQEDGCYFNLYFNGSAVEEKFIIFKKNKPKSYFKKWAIYKSPQHHTRDHYTLNTANLKGRNES